MDFFLQKGRPQSSYKIVKTVKKGFKMSFFGKSWLILGSENLKEFMDKKKKINNCFQQVHIKRGGQGQDGKNLKKIV